MCSHVANQIRMRGVMGLHEERQPKAASCTRVVTSLVFTELPIKPLLGSSLGLGKSLLFH